jgi:hypothetical protein
VDGVSDLVESRAAGQVGVLLGFQNTEMLGADLCGWRIVRRRVCG